jgi:hypothetical protein
VVVPHNPVDVAVIVAVPKNIASQSMTPVVPFIDPAVAGDTVYTIEVLLAAVAVYVVFAASWHTVTGPSVNIVGPVDGFTVTTTDAVVVPHKPVDVAVIMAGPKNDASQFIIPVAASITPAPAGKTEYAIEVLFAAVAVYVVFAASWQSVVAPPVKLVGPVVGLTVTTLSAVVVPHNPVAVALIVAVP